MDDNITTLNELKIWIGSQFTLLQHGQNDILYKIGRLERADTIHELSIAKLSEESTYKKGADAKMKTVYSLGGAFVGTVFTLGIELLRGIIR